MSNLDLDTTLVRRGTTAATFGDINAFVDEIRERPLDKLIGDLAGLARLSETKYALTRQIVRQRLRALPEVEREQLCIFADEIVRAAAPEDVERIRNIFVQDSRA